MQTGNSSRRRRQLEYSSDDSSDTKSMQDVLEKDQNEDNNVNLVDSARADEHENLSGDEKIDLEELRKMSRRSYLDKRSRSKLEELKRELDRYEDLEAKGKQFSQAEKDMYVEEKRTYNIIIENIENEVDNEHTLYSIPDGYTNEIGFIDRKRKLGLLKSKAKPEFADSESNIKRKKNAFENDWESHQLNKAIINVENSGEIQVKDSEKYEYVFDESAFVKFSDSSPMEGDELEEEKATNSIYASNLKIQEFRKTLPVYKYRSKFLEAIKENQILIVVGETGSGKTTQLTQYLHEAGYSKSKDGKSLKIGCTQPRRVAATSVATRVAEEMGVALGEEVGYSIRFEDESSEKTIIKYLTDGMLLREFLVDPELSSFGAIMIDEAHERTISTEIILSLLKDISKVRTDLKIIVASATMNAEKFSSFFDGAPIFNIPGRRFPVDIYYTQNPEANYIQAALTTIFQIHTTQEMPGDILVFLTGQEEIDTMQESLNEAVSRLGSSVKPLIICPVYANLPNDLQKKIFEPTPPDTRKVVLATNIAETSITINGISYVVDPGYVKENVYNPVTGMESLIVVPCSQASANQRAGRAGRVGPGKCFRLYTKWSFHNEIPENSTPEILRVNLLSTILLLLSLGITDLINFEFIDAPSSDALMKSLELLYALGALNSEGELTKEGRQMSEFPIDPTFAKCLITSAKLSVSCDVISIVAMLSENSGLFYRPKDKKEQADKKKEEFFDNGGDHFMLLNIWDQWVQTGFSSQWCQDNFLQYRSLKRIRQVREQLERLCISAGLGIDTSESINKKKLIEKAFISGFFHHSSRLSKMGDSYILVKQKHPVFVHPSSSLYKLKPPPKLLLYHELVLTSKEYMRGCMTIDSDELTEVTKHYYSKTELQMINTSKILKK